MEEVTLLAEYDRKVYNQPMNVTISFIHVASHIDCLLFIHKATCLLVCLLTLYHRQYG